MRKQDLARAAEVAVISIKFLYYKHDSLAAKVGSVGRGGRCRFCCGCRVGAWVGAYIHICMHT